MKVFLAVIALAFSVSGLPTNPPGEGNIIMTFADDGKTPIYENLDDPVPVGEAVDIKKVHFMLYTRLNRVDSQELKANDASGLKKSNYDSSNPTVVLVHGWQNSHQSESVQIVKDSYLQTGDVNVILYDYEQYNSPYLTAVGNAEALGKTLATFINYLIDNGQSVSKLHIIGHSLGSHISGFAGNNIKGTVARITGLDPAGPMFENKWADGRLSKDDAAFVDIVHTSTSLGLKDAIGAVDFFPHGGHAQPSCAGNSLSDGCDHAASYRYFSETIKNKNLYPSLKCNNVDDAKVADPAQNPCKSSNVFMGEGVDTRTTGFYYVSV